MFGISPICAFTWMFGVSVKEASYSMHLGLGSKILTFLHLGVILTVFTSSLFLSVSFFILLIFPPPVYTKTISFSLPYLEQHLLLRLHAYLNTVENVYKRIKESTCQLDAITCFLSKSSLLDFETSEMWFRLPKVLSDL